MDNLIDSLNPDQRAAVSAGNIHMLVLAGAGSGKTRVLVHRIAWLLEQQQASPHQILAVTFTNKAAREMQQRIEQMLGFRQPGLWVGTFHGLCHRLLRSHWQEAGLNEDFQIIDSDDQLRIIRRLLKANEIDDKRWPAKQVCWMINNEKQNGRRASAVTLNGDYFQEVMLNIYRQYEELCQRSSLVDFTELLLRGVELLQNNQELREHYQQRFKYILVDEFQDINNMQYKWIKLMACQDNYTFAVGDDDQSIYSWRGAEVANLHRFQQDYPNCQLIRLEQNYRSSKTILKAANAVITKNSNRLGKELWTEQEQGEKISVFAAFNEREEANFVIEKIRALSRAGSRYQDIAIVYRANALSRLLEEHLLESNIPYRVYGGQRFFERAEIKDALAYLRLVVHPDDDASFERIVNTPTRGIGQATLNIVRNLARSEQIPLWQAGAKILESKQLSARANNCLQLFFNLIGDLAQTIRGIDLGEQTEHVIQASGLLGHYKKDRSEKGISRVENIEELINATREFEPTENSEQSALSEFLSAVSLETDKNQEQEDKDSVNLMTLHSAKGLEFDTVFIVGLEDGLFPHQMSLDEANGLEEERRLCYVGMTRAKKKLFLSYAESRQQHGREQFNRPSRFLRELPEDCLDMIRFSHAKRVTAAPEAFHNDFVDEPAHGLQFGQRVNHPRFGAGTICGAEGNGAHARVQVRFDTHGSKWLVLQYANLSIL